MMSPKFSLQKPYVVASLPNPIDHSNGRYVVGDVYGGAPGSKKRKRSELAVGVDGEGVNLYDVRFCDCFSNIFSNFSLGILLEINYFLRTATANFLHLFSLLDQDSSFEEQD